MIIKVSTILIFLIISIILLTGKGTNLIAGYNTMSSDEKNKYDGIALSKFMGKIMFLCFIFMTLTILGYNWIEITGVIGLVVSIIFSLIYTNTNNRFKK